MLSSTKHMRAQRADTRTPIRAVRSVALDASQISKLGTILATRASTFEPCRGGLVHSKNARALEYRKPNAHNSKSSKRTSESTSFPIHDRKTPRNIYPFGPWIDPPFRSAANEFRIPITLRSGPVSNEKFSRIGHHGFVTRENYVTAYRNGSGIERLPVACSSRAYQNALGNNMPRITRKSNKARDLWWMRRSRKRINIAVPKNRAQ